MLQINLLKKNKDLNKELNQRFIECIATCHSATIMNGEIIGDPIDVRIFEASNWDIFDMEDSTKSKSNPNIPNEELNYSIYSYVRPNKNQVQKIK